MLSIGGDDAIALFKHGNDPGRDRFLAVIEVEEAANLFLRVEFGAFLLEAADADHEPQEIEHMRTRQVAVWSAAASSLIAFQRGEVALG